MEIRQKQNKWLQIGDLVAKIPIIQGGMGVGVSLSSLAGAVAKEGAIGIISTAQIGYREPDFDQAPLKANLRSIHKEVKKAREIAGNAGIIGVNIMVATKKYSEYVKEAVRAKVDLIISGAGLPMELPKIVKEEWEKRKESGEKIRLPKLVPIVSSKKAANLILKMWDRKEQVIPDAIIIEGPKAGGHLGFKKEELMDIEGLEYDNEMKSIIEAVKVYEEKYQKKIPVIVAGGITNKSQMEHYFQMGASGIQVATPFVTTKECDADEKFKQAYISCTKEDIILTKSPVGMPGRALKNRFQNRVEEEGKIPVEHCHSCISKCNPEEIPYCITEALIRAVKGDVENGLVFCGADAYLADKITTVKEVLSRYC